MIVNENAVPAVGVTVEKVKLASAPATCDNDAAIAPFEKPVTVEVPPVLVIFTDDKAVPEVA